MEYFVPEDSFCLKKDKGAYAVVKESKLKKNSFNGPLLAVESGKRDKKLLFGKRPYNNLIIDSDYYERGLDNYFCTSISKKIKLDNAPSFILLSDTSKLYDENIDNFTTAGYRVYNFDFQNPDKSDKFAPLKDLFDQRQSFIDEEKLTPAAASEKLSFFAKNFIKALFSWDEKSPFEFATIELLEAYLLAMLEDGVNLDSFTPLSFYKKVYQKDLETKDTYDKIEKYFATKSDFVKSKASTFLDFNLKAKSSMYKTMLQKINYLKDKKLNEFLTVESLDIDDFVAYPSVIFIKHNNNPASIYSHFTNLLIDKIITKLLDKARTTLVGQLPKHIDIFIENILTLGKINIMPYIMTLGRSRNISTSMLVSSYEDIKLIYQEEADIIISNCTNTLMFACKDKETVENICQIAVPVKDTIYAGKIATKNEKRIMTSRAYIKADLDSVDDDEYLLKISTRSLTRSKWQTN